MGAGGGRVGGPGKQLRGLAGLAAAGGMERCLAPPRPRTQQGTAPAVAPATVRWQHRTFQRAYPSRHARLGRLAYDGRGNAVVRSEADIPAAVESLGGYEKGLYAEK